MQFSFYSRFIHRFCIGERETINSDKNSLLKVFQIKEELHLQLEQFTQYYMELMRNYEFLIAFSNHLWSIEHT